MAKKDSVLRYIFIMNKLRKGPATFKEIDEYLEHQSEIQGANYNVSKRQFQRDLKDIESLFELLIEFDFRRQVYSIIEDETSDISRQRMEALDVFHALKFGESSAKSIHFECRKPKGTENLFGLLHAIKNRLQVTFIHEKYWEEISTQRVVDPFALKEFKSRWYLIAKDHKDNRIKRFGLDRITDLEIRKALYKLPSDFDVNDFFKNSFGIINDSDYELQDIILSFIPEQGKYIKSLPLHESQEIIVDNENEVRIRLKVYISYDFMMELLSFGEKVKVISPDCLIKEITGKLKDTLLQYEK